MKELARNMSRPKTGDWIKLKRLARYLVGRERVVIVWAYQDSVSSVDVWVDSDYEGCRRTRKSTSGV